MIPEIPCFQSYCLYSYLLPSASKINPKTIVLTPLLPNSLTTQKLPYVYRQFPDIAIKAKANQPKSTTPSCFLPSIIIFSGRSKRTWRT